LWGDPHVNVFDRDVLHEHGRGASMNMFAHGDYWLVRSSDVFIQGRYWSTREDGASSTRALAVGGPFLQNHTLIVEPLDGQVTWDGKAILQGFPSEEDIPSLLVARYHDAGNRIRDGLKHAVVGSVELELPLNVRITVNRWQDHIDVMITMRIFLDQKVDGHCGNFNGDASDDTAELIKARMTPQVFGVANLFVKRSYSYVGCFRDSKHYRDLPIYKGMHMKIEECALACSGYDYFGHQWKRECWCGNSSGRHGRASQSECACGTEYVGDHRNCVYRYGEDRADNLRRKVDLTLADCAAAVRANASALCREAAASEGMQASGDFLESCILDVCFASPEYARADASMRRQQLARVLGTSVGHPNMRFVMPASGTGHIRWATHPGLCLRVRGAARRTAKVQLADCREADAFLLPANGLGEIRLARSPDMCLDVATGHRHNGNNVQLWRCGSDHPNMRFAVPLHGQGRVRWASHPEFCLDVSAGRAKPGTSVQLWHCE